MNTGQKEWRARSSSEPFGAVSAGLSKQVLKGKGTLKFNIRDIFYTQVVEGDINFKSTEAHFKNWRDTRVANITFTYRFGKPMDNQTVESANPYIF